MIRVSGALENWLQSKGTYEELANGVLQGHSVQRSLVQCHANRLGELDQRDLVGAARLVLELAVLVHVRRHVVRQGNCGDGRQRALRGRAALFVVN